jgi:hypothetical protein
MSWPTFEWALLHTLSSSKGLLGLYYNIHRRPCLGPWLEPNGQVVFLRGKQQRIPLKSGGNR